MPQSSEQNSKPKELMQTWHHSYILSTSVNNATMIFLKIQDT
jgi:hypothetical protein